MNFNNIAIISLQSDNVIFHDMAVSTGITITGKQNTKIKTNYSINYH